MFLSMVFSILVTVVGDYITKKGMCCERNKNKNRYHFYITCFRRKTGKTGCGKRWRGQQRRTATGKSIGKHEIGWRGSEWKKWK